MTTLEEVDLTQVATALGCDTGVARSLADDVLTKAERAGRHVGHPTRYVIAAGRRRQVAPAEPDHTDDERASDLIAQVMAELDERFPAVDLHALARLGRANVLALAAMTDDELEQQVRMTDASRVLEARAALAGMPGAKFGPSMTEDEIEYAVWHEDRAAVVLRGSLWVAPSALNYAVPYSNLFVNAEAKAGRVGLVIVLGETWTVLPEHQVPDEERQRRIGLAKALLGEPNQEWESFGHIGLCWVNRMVDLVVVALRVLTTGGAA